MLKFCRGALARWLAVAVLAPLLVLSPFGGRTIVAHGHAGHGVHFHALEGPSSRQVAAAARQALENCSAFRGCGDHDHGPADGPGPGDQEEPGGVSVPEYEPFRSWDTNLNMAGRAWTASVSWWMAPARYTGQGPGLRPPKLVDAAGAPPGWPLRAGDRLVRTSRALLI